MSEVEVEQPLLPQYKQKIECVWCHAHEPFDPNERFYHFTDTIRFPRSNKLLALCKPICYFRYRIESEAVSRTGINNRMGKPLNEEQFDLLTAKKTELLADEELTELLSLEASSKFNDNFRYRPPPKQFDENASQTVSLQSSLTFPE